MNIKGLLLGSAAAMVAVSGAKAADAIIIAEPEPMEYVRICDAYGAGFFYIPGTETCLKIGGYVRYQMDYNRRSYTTHPTFGFVNDTGTSEYLWSKTARFAPSFDVRSETAWGTLRGFAEVEFDWNSVDGQSTNLNHAFIEIGGGSGTFLVGKTDNPYARLFYGAAGAYDGDYGGQIYNSGEVSYTFAPGNGFTGVVALVETGTGTFHPNVEAGAKFEQDWGAVGGIVGYDSVNKQWGAQGVVQVNFAPVSLGVHLLYSSDRFNTYGATHPFATVSSSVSEWSVLAHASVAVNDKLSVNGYVQWFDGIAPTWFGDAWQVKGGLVWEPVTNLQIIPEARYSWSKITNGPFNGDSVSQFDARLRFNRNF